MKVNYVAKWAAKLAEGQDPVEDIIAIMRRCKPKMFRFDDIPPGDFVVYQYCKGVTIVTSPGVVTLSRRYSHKSKRYAILMRVKKQGDTRIYEVERYYLIRQPEGAQEKAYVEVYICAGGRCRREEEVKI